jgi:hypothetical protein
MLAESLPVSPAVLSVGLQRFQNAFLPSPKGSVTSVSCLRLGAVIAVRAIVGRILRACGVARAAVDVRIGPASRGGSHRRFTGRVIRTCAPEDRVFAHRRKGVAAHLGAREQLIGWIRQVGAGQQDLVEVAHAPGLADGRERDGRLPQTSATKRPRSCETPTSDRGICLGRTHATVQPSRPVQEY